jgi:hypothetical protein
MANKIKDSNITPGTIAADKLAGGITNSQLAGSIATSKLATDLSNASNISSGTLANARLTGSGAITINGTSIALGASGTIVAGTDWQAVKTANYTAVAGQGVFANTTGGAFTVTLPASPTTGDEVTIVDYAGTFASNNLTVARNSSKIDGATADTTLDVNRTNVRFVFIDATQGWRSVFDDVATVYGTSYINATGGTVSTVATNYKVHLFNSSGNFVVNSGAGPLAKVDYLVLGGGGGGGGNPDGGNPSGGGGGAGCYRESHSAPVSGPYSASPIATSSPLSELSPGTYPITVGAGAARGSGTTRGSSSIFSTITSAGGGNGGANPGGSGNYVGNPGGSGGGASGNGGSSNFAGGSGNTPPVSPAQGRDGGSIDGGGPGAQGDTTGGGGGASGDGANADSPNTASGRGGTGTPSAITGSAIARAGGGGGGGRDCNGVCNGAASPCGTGTAGGSATDAAANKGGGGGGRESNGQSGGAGGSGVVIIRYRFQ